LHPTIDLNADLGEGSGQPHLSRDEALLDLVSSANIACGFHAGDATTMRDTVRAAKARGVTIGAHPSYPDISGFGRRELGLAPREIRLHVAYQLRALRDVCGAENAKLAYVKPHGALYNRAAKDSRAADAIVNAISEVEPSLVLLGLAGSEMTRAAARNGISFASEAFADWIGACIDRKLQGFRYIKRIGGFIGSINIIGLDFDGRTPVPKGLKCAQYGFDHGGAVRGGIGIRLKIAGDGNSFKHKLIETVAQRL